MASCANCGARLPKTSRYCPQCGQPSSAGDTRVMEVPPDETGRVPVHYERAEPRYYGIAPTTLLLGLAAAVLALAIVLLVTAHWPFGLIALGVGILLIVVFVEAARRRPDAIARSTADALDTFRSRAAVATESLATRGRAARQVLALRREVQRMATLRKQLLFELGDAVYRGDEQATEAGRGRVAELDELVQQREGEMQEVMARAQDRLQRRRLEVQVTEMVEIPEEPAAPGEQNPLGPAVIPEPYPPPDEGNPPQPAVIPEPGPAVIPEPGPQGPEESGS